MAYIIDQKETVVVDMTGSYVCCVENGSFYALEIGNGIRSVIVGYFETPEKAQEAVSYVIKSLMLHEEFVRVPKSKISERLNLDGTFRTD